MTEKDSPKDKRVRIDDSMSPETVAFKKSATPDTTDSGSKEGASVVPDVTAQGDGDTDPPPPKRAPSKK